MRRWVALVIAASAVACSPPGVPSSDNNGVPNEWTDEYKDATWRKFNKGQYRDVYDRECVLAAFEDEFPDPRESERLFKENRARYEERFSEAIDVIREEC